MPRISDRISDRIQQLEQKIANVEKDADFDALGSEIVDVEIALHRELESDVAAVERNKSEFQRGHNVFARAFSPSARSEWRQTVGDAEAALGDAREGELRLHQVKARFFDDKMRVHAREFIRVAHKVERDVTGGFEEKSAAAAGRWLAHKSGDDAIGDVDEFRSRHPDFADDSDAILAAVMSARWIDVDGDALLSGAASLANRTDASAVLAALRATHALPKAKADARLIEAASLLSKASAQECAATLVAMSNSTPTMWDGPAPIVAATILTSTKPDRALAFADEIAKAMAGAEGCAQIIAAGIVAGMHDDVEAIARAVSKSVAGTTAARSVIAAAGIIAHRNAEEIWAFAKHVQSQLPGSWESEADVIAAGLLGSPSAPATETAKRAFFLPGVGRARDEE